MADVLKELDRLDRFDGPFMGPGRQRRYFERMRHFYCSHHFGGAGRVLYPPPLVVARHLLRKLERALNNQRLPSSLGGDRDQEPEQIQKPVASFDIEADAQRQGQSFLAQRRHDPIPSSYVAMRSQLQQRLLDSSGRASAGKAALLLYAFDQEAGLKRLRLALSGEVPAAHDDSAAACILLPSRASLRPGSNCRI
jgi:hypothetical protein